MNNLGEKAVNHYYHLLFMRRVLLVFFIFTLTVSSAFSRIPGTKAARLGASLGYGYPEAICIKLKYGNNFQAGIMQSFDTQGAGPTALEFYYRFGEKPRLLEQKPWYFMAGSAVYLFNVNYKKQYSFLFYPRIGRSFDFSKYSGIRFDIGPGFPFGRDEENTSSISPVVLSGSLCLYLRF
jgi:hypothetical protein